MRELSGGGGEYLNNPAMANTYNKDPINFDLTGAQNKINPLIAERNARFNSSQSVAAPEPSKGGGSPVPSSGPTGAPVAQQVYDVVTGKKKPWK